MSERVGWQVEAVQAREAEAVLADKIVPIKPIPRIYVCMDGIGVPAVKNETEGRQGKGEDGQARTREAKLGGVLTLMRVNKESRPVHEESTSYTGAIEPAEAFGQRIYAKTVGRTFKE